MNWHIPLAQKYPQEKHKLAMDYYLARSIQAFDQSSWDAIAGSQIAMTYRWQRVMEASRQHYQPHYALVEDSQGPLAIMAANAAESLPQPGWRDRLSKYLTLVFRGPFSPMDCGITLRSGSTWQETLPLLEPVWRRLCWQAKRPLFGINNIATEDLPVWRARRFLASAQSPDTILDLPSDYDQYLQQLTKKDRAELRRMRRRAAPLDVSFEVGPLGNESELLYTLLCEVFVHHGTPTSAMAFTSELFSAMRRELPNDIIVFKGFVDGTLAGYLLCLVCEQTLWWLIAGLRYELARPNYIYFLLIDEMVRWGIKHNIRHIHGGMTNEREKQKHGFHLRDRWFCYRPSVPFDKIFALGRFLPGRSFAARVNG